MASKRFYSKTIKNSMTEGKDLQTIYEELNAMSDVERETRIGEIDTEIDEIARLMLNRQMNPNANADKTESLKQRAEKLRKEQKMLKLFPKVRKKLKRIANAQRRTRLQKIEKQNKLQGQYMSLRAELRRIEKQIESLNGEIEEAKAIAKTVKGKRTQEAMQSAIKDLEDEKAQIGDQTELRTKVAEAKAEYQKYIDGKSEEDKIINKCKMPWNLLLSGMEWQDIAVISNQKLSEMIGMKRRDKENSGPQQETDNRQRPDGRGQGTDEPNPNAGTGSNPNPDLGQDAGAGSNPNLDLGQDAGAGSNPNLDLDQDAGTGSNPNPDLDQGAGTGSNSNPDLDQGAGAGSNPNPDLDSDDLPVILKWSDRHPKLAKFKPLAFIMDKVSAFIDKHPRLAKLFRRNERPNGPLFDSREDRDSKDVVIDITNETDINKIKGLLIREGMAVNRLNSKIARMEKFPEIQAPLRPILADGRRNINFEGASLEALQSTAAVFIGQGIYTTEEMIDIMKEAAKREGVDPSTVEIKEPENGYLEPLRDLVDKQVRYLLPKDIEEREESWKLAKLYSDEELERIKEAAQKNQEKEDNTRKDMEEELLAAKQRKAELQAKYDELNNGAKPDKTLEAGASLKDGRKELVSRLREGVPGDPTQRYSDMVVEDIGKIVDEALTEPKQPDDDQEQL